MRLVTVRQEDLTIVRKKRGKGFCYLDADGVLVCDPEFKRRVAQLGIPPAWQDVRIALSPKAHIQCIGTDAAGRLQYIYHADWEKKRSARKQERLSLLTSALPRIRRRVALDIRAEAGSLKLALALGVALIDQTAMRVGREKYLEANGTRGAGTLFSRDVTVNGAEVQLDFAAKSGKQAHYVVQDARLADAVTRIKTLPGKRLLVYRNDEGKVRPIKTGMINTYLKEISGADISAKDFRTLHASALAAEALAQIEPGGSESARKRQIAKVTREVSDFLRNTPMICRKSYIAPCLFQLFDNGKLYTLWNQPAEKGAGLKPREKRLGQVLESLVPKRSGGKSQSDPSPAP